VWYQKAAEQGDKSAQNRLGEMLLEGLGTQQKPATAVQWILKSAKAGFVPAQINLAEIYGGGIGASYDPEAALSWAKKGVGSGNSEAMLELALLEFEGIGSPPKPEEACSLWERAGERHAAVCYLLGKGRPKDPKHAARLLGETASEEARPSEEQWSLTSHLHDPSLTIADAEFLLSMIYDTGAGVDRNGRYAEALAIDAAEITKNLATYDYRAQFLLAVVNERGAGVTPDFQEAAKLLSSSAEIGHKYSQRELAALYLRGAGVRKDIDIAVHLLKEASARDDDEATTVLAEVYFGPPFREQTLAFNPDQAFVLFKKAAERDYATAEFGVGYCYAMGRGVPQDYSLASSWYRRASDHGQTTATNNLAMMYQTGQGVPKDLNQAADLLEKAANLGNPKAEVNYGMNFEYGRARPKDFGLAVYWLHKAADQGDRDAPKHLAEIYQQGGHGITKDQNQAEFWTARAAEAGKPVAKPGSGGTGQTLASLLTQTALNLQQQKLQGEALNKQAIAQALGQAAASQVTQGSGTAPQP
jgi:TPR repeat protein